jgi:hypothetical protein
MVYTLLTSLFCFKWLEKNGRTNYKNHLRGLSGWVVKTLVSYHEVDVRPRFVATAGFLANCEKMCNCEKEWADSLSPSSCVVSNPVHTDVTVWESLSIYFWKVDGLSLNALYNVSGFSLPPIKTDHHYIMKNCWVWWKMKNKQKQ